MPGGWFFRVVDHNPPKSADFLSQAEQGRAQMADPCCRQGLSVFADVQEAIGALRVLRRYVRRRKLAIGYLGNPEDRILFTPTHHYPRSHHTWWAAMGTVRENGFAVIES